MGVYNLTKHLSQTGLQLHLDTSGKTTFLRSLWDIDRFEMMTWWWNIMHRVKMSDKDYSLL